MNRPDLIRRAAQKLVPWLLPVIVLVAWQLASMAGILSSKILPAPTDVLKAAWDLTVTGKLFRHLLISFQRALFGFVIGGSIGLMLGLANGLFGPCERLLDTTIQMIRNIPHLAMILLVILWFGIGEEAKVFLVAVGVLFPVYVNTFHGIRSVNPGLLEMGRVYGLRPWACFVPARSFAGGAALVGVRYALGIMWLTLIVAETISAEAGIGYMAMNAREFMQTDVVLLSILLYALFGKLADSLARWLERRWLAWNPNYQNV